MSRLAASFVLGYHGCDAGTARKVVNGKTALLKSEKDYDWLGPGAYFWESDSQRADEWARAHRATKTPAVVGAVIDLGNCLDLLARENLELVKLAHKALVEDRQASGLDMPVNRGLAEKAGELPLRFLDCAVIRLLHKIVKDGGREPFDTVRGMFPEGKPLYPGAGFQERNHIQLAVCNMDCIKGVFYPPDMAPKGK